MIYQNILITNLEDGVTIFMMTLDLKLRKIGNSMMIAIPSQLVTDL